MSHPKVSSFDQRQDSLRIIYNAAASNLDDDQILLLTQVVQALNEQVYQQNGLIWELNVRIKEQQAELERLQKDLLYVKSCQ